jgi:hypothetical protein
MAIVIANRKRARSIGQRFIDPERTNVASPGNATQLDHGASRRMVKIGLKHAPIASACHCARSIRCHCPRSWRIVITLRSKVGQNEPAILTETLFLTRWSSLQVVARLELFRPSRS